MALRLAGAGAGGGLGAAAGVLVHLRVMAWVWWCGHFQGSFDGGPTLSSKVLAEIASFGLPLFIDNYFATTES